MKSQREGQDDQEEVKEPGKSQPESQEDQGEVNDPEGSQEDQGELKNLGKKTRRNARRTRENHTGGLMRVLSLEVDDHATVLEFTADLYRPPRV